MGVISGFGFTSPTHVYFLFFLFFLSHEKRQIYFNDVHTRVHTYTTVTPYPYTFYVQKVSY